MADWTNLPNAAVGVGGLPSGTTVTALRDNPVAIAQGAAGAPRANGKMAATLLEYSTSNPLAGLSAGNLVLPVGVFDEYSFSNTNATVDGVFQSAGTCEISSRATGTMRFLATQSVSAPTANTGTCTIRILKNSTEVQQWSISATFGSATENRLIDLSAQAGDVFEWQVRINFTSADRTASITNISVRADDTYTTQPLQLKVSEVRP